MSDLKADGFDWVTARQKCSLETVFHVLSEIIDSNVKTANALPKMESRFESKVLNRKLIVLRQDDEGETTSVVLEFSANAISVKRVTSRGESHLPLFTAKPSLTDEGNCVLEIDEKTFCLWQVSRRALEDLFFPR